MAVLEIDGNVVEIGNDKLVFSKVGYSFDDWVTKDIPYSERVTLPETSLLNSIFFRPYSPQISTQKFSKFHTYKYKDNGKIVSSGVAKLLSFNSRREYELQLLDGSFALFENLKNQLNALSLESSDFIFNTTNYNSLKVLNSSVWIWAASSMHQNKTLAKNILSGNLAFSRPFFSVKRLLEAMFSVNGWTYELGINVDFFDTLIVSAKSEFVFTSYEKAFNGSLASGNLDLSSPIFIQGDTVSPSTQLNITYDSKLRLRGIANADNDFILTLTVTGTDPQVQTFILNQGEFDYDLTSNEFTAGDSIVINLSGSGNVSFTNFLIYTIIDENNFGNVSLANFTNYKVKTYDNLPEIDQIDLFKNCLVKIGGYFASDNFKKNILINTVGSLSYLGAQDWTDKFIEDSDEIELLRGYGQLNYFSYDNSDIKPSNQGRGSFTIDNETLQDVETIYSSIFAASGEVTIINQMVDNTVYDDVERLNEINNLIAYYEPISDYTVARFEQLNGNNILSNYYINFIKAIQKGELFTAGFNLNKSDFFLFDFTKLVYLQQKQSVFYVLGVNNYSEDDITEVILLKT
jgi:hypothetical protein